MKNLTPQALLDVLNPVLELFQPYIDKEFYVPEMVGFDTGYIMETYAKDEESLSDELDTIIHNQILLLDFEYQYDTHYIKIVEINKLIVAIKIEYGVTFAISIFPCIVLFNHQGERDYVPLATSTQIFVTSEQLDPDNSIYCDPVDYVDQTLSLESFPEPALTAMFKALREYSKTLDIKLFLPSADIPSDGVTDILITRTHHERQQARIEHHVVIAKPRNPES